MNERSRAATQRRLATALGAAAFVGYVGWNLAWWWRGQVAPSIFSWATGLPCPTTGGTRSIRALANGDVAASIALHPFAVPLATLFVVSVCQALVRGRLAAWMPSAWLWVLAFSWVSKI